MNFEEIAELEKRVLIQTYDRLPILAVGGEGCYLYDDRGRKYLDFLGGLAVNALGYAHPEVMAVLRDETETLLHVSNLLYHRYQAPLAENTGGRSLRTQRRGVPACGQRVLGRRLYRQEHYEGCPARRPDG